MASESGESSKLRRTGSSAMLPGMLLTLRTRILALAAAAAATTLACVIPSAVTASANPPPVPAIGHTGTWMDEPPGQVVILHGLTEVYKVPPYEPSADGFGDDDAAFL